MKVFTIPARLLAALDFRFLQRLGWMGLAELASRLSRLLTVLALAYWLSLEEFGVCAMAATLLEVVRSAAQGGFNAKIAGCVENDLATHNHAAHRLNLAYNSIAALCFGLLAWPLEQVLELPGLAVLMFALLPNFFIYPWVAVRVFNAHRQQQMRAVGTLTGLTICVDNVLTAAGLYIGFGIYSIAVAKFCAALVWFTCWLCLTHKPSSKVCEPALYCELVIFSKRVIGTELIKAIRAQADVLIAAWALAPAHLGLYTFAKNAGVGLSQSLMNAYAVVVLPWLAQNRREGVCESRSNRQLRLMCAALAGVFLLQAASAFIYVPLLFGPQWHEATSLVAILCLSALPRIVIDTFALRLRAYGLVAEELRLISVCTFVPILVLGTTLLANGIREPSTLAFITTFAACCGLVGLFVTELNHEKGENYEQAAAG